MSKIRDLTGQRFGSRTVLSRAENTSHGNARWNVLCDCGSLGVTTGGHLNHGDSQTCVECKYRKHRVAPLLGRTFGSRTVLGQAPRSRYRIVQCVCGAVDEVLASDLRRGVAHNCAGCYTSSVSEAAAATRNSGQIPEWYLLRVFENAARRNLPVEVSLEYLAELWAAQGGRCALSGWKLEWFKKRRATASLDRIDSSLGYVPGNVQWTHRDVNRHKGAASDKDFIDMCRAVAAHAEITLTDTLVPGTYPYSAPGGEPVL